MHDSNEVIVDDLDELSTSSSAKIFDSWYIFDIALNFGSIIEFDDEQTDNIEANEVVENDELDFQRNEERLEHVLKNNNIPVENQEPPVHIEPKMLL